MMMSRRRLSRVVLRTTVHPPRISSLRCFSAETPSAPKVFSSPRMEEIFNQLVALDKPDRKIVTRIVLAEVGVDLDKENAMQEAFLASGGGGAASAEEAVVEEVKTAFDLKLLSFDAKAKIKIIKEVRSIAGLGLKEAKDLVEGAPKVIKKGLKQEEADELKAKLIEIGAEVEVS